MQVKCSSCSHTFRVEGHQWGGEVDCPACRKRLSIPKAVPKNTPADSTSVGKDVTAGYVLPSRRGTMSRPWLLWIGGGVGLLAAVGLAVAVACLPDKKEASNKPPSPEQMADALKTLGWAKYANGTVGILSPAGNVRKDGSVDYPSMLKDTDTEALAAIGITVEQFVAGVQALDSSEYHDAVFRHLSPP